MFRAKPYRSYRFHAQNLFGFAVAPHTGAWIEISYFPSSGYYMGVAPHTGAWIEIRL